MPRAGSTKVKTGCFTCKSRKVKCDESRPHCQRCLLAGRPCTGYPDVRGQAKYSWADLLAAAAEQQHSHHQPLPNHSDPRQVNHHHHHHRRLLLPTLSDSSATTVVAAAAGIDKQDARALAFFRAQVAPALSRHSSAPFWTVLVSQVGAVQPAVHHALAAISALYEGLAEQEGEGAAVAPLPRARARLAITHYNRALGYVKAPQQTDSNVVLLVCLLFICIEILQGDKAMAIAHCRHGILICNNLPEGALRGWAREELGPMFLRLATFPYFFGMEAGDFPEPRGLVAMGDGDDGGGAVDRWSSTVWDALVNRTVRIVRQGLSHRQGPLRDSPVPETLVQDQRRTLADLVVWREHYRAQRMTLSLAEGDSLEAHLYREMESIVGMIWMGCCLDATELAYDAHLADFADLLALSQQLIDRRPTRSEPRPIFSFEMGFTPFLYFVVLKCRHLELRVRALRHILRLGYDRENLFNTRVMYSVGQRLVELEHGTRLNPAWPECIGDVDRSMPGDGSRVRTADITEEKEVRVDDSGRDESYTKVYFLLGPGATVPVYTEWVRAQPWSNLRPVSPEPHSPTEPGCGKRP